MGRGSPRRRKASPAPESAGTAGIIALLVEVFATRAAVSPAELHDLMFLVSDDSTKLDFAYVFRLRQDRVRSEDLGARLSILEAEIVLQRDARGDLEPGPRFRELVALMRLSHSLVEAAQRAVRRFAGDSGEALARLALLRFLSTRSPEASAAALAIRYRRVTGLSVTNVQVTRDLKRLRRREEP